MKGLVRLSVLLATTLVLALPVSNLSANPTDDPAVQAFIVSMAPRVVSTRRR
jgi:hypothetical protein